MFPFKKKKKVMLILFLFVSFFFFLSLFRSLEKYLKDSILSQELQYINTSCYCMEASGEVVNDLLCYEADTKVNNLYRFQSMVLRC